MKATDVRKLREKLKLSQSEFAAKFGFSPACVRNWEQGRNSPIGAARHMSLSMYQLVSQ